jgi:hypothetical protein
VSGFGSQLKNSRFKPLTNLLLVFLHQFHDLRGVFGLRIVDMNNFLEAFTLFASS